MYWKCDVMAGYECIGVCDQEKFSPVWRCFTAGLLQRNGSGGSASQTLLDRWNGGVWLRG